MYEHKCGVFTDEKWVPVENGAVTMDSELVSWIKELFSYT
jgi:hypothetical protein